ncbi:MAG: tetratricopeptide repeat protein [Patescibacteria group bacterium]
MSEERKFIPHIAPRDHADISEPAPAELPSDSIGSLLQKVAQYAVLALLALAPLFFTPGLWATLNFDKFLLGVTLVAVVAVAGSLLALRRRFMYTALPIALGVYWLVVLAALVSALLSGGGQDATRGSVFEPQTVGFLALLGALMTAPLVLQGARRMTARALTWFGVAAGVLLVYNILRIVFGASFLSLGSFSDITASPIGGLNDLAIISGVVILIGLIALLQLPLRAWLLGVIAIMIALATFMLMVVNIFSVWLIIGFFALLLLVYLLSRDTLFASANEEVSPLYNARTLLGVTAMLCIVSATFIVAGESAGARISELTNVQYVEVRPSPAATMNIARSVYGSDALLGAGPNLFVDAWRLHKDRSINETLFWNTDFVAGSGFVPTLFVNLGMLGGVLFLAFHVLFLLGGYRMLVRTTKPDPYWFFFAAATFAAATFIWIMSYLYVPGATVLMLGALFTGLTFVAYGALVPETVRTIPLVTNRRRGFFLMAAIIAVITTSVATLFTVGEQYVAQADFNRTSATAESITAFEEQAITSFNLYPDDRFIRARAQVQLGTLNDLLGIAEPTQEQQQQFVTAAQQGIALVDRAIATDPTEPANYATLAGIHSALAAAQVPGSLERATSSLAAAQQLDPLNPQYNLQYAQLAARIGDVARARSEISQALQLKRNYTQALFLSAQLDINEGDTESAIQTTRALITLEPNNPTRYFQLGFLYAATGDYQTAIQAYQAAIQLDQNYANARYLLALALLQENDREGALAQLRRVQENNEDNEQLQALISQVESGESVDIPDLGLEPPVREAAPSTDNVADSVLSEGATDTDLVAPVNTVASEEGSATTTAPIDIATSSPATTSDPAAE